MRTPEPWNAPATAFAHEHVQPLGITRRRLATAVRSGQVQRLRHGVYVASRAIPEDPVAMHLLRALAEQVAAPGLVDSHETAALAHGLPLLMGHRAATGRVVLTAEAGPQRRTRASQSVVVRLADLAPHHVTRLPSGLVVTTSARTAADLAARAALPEALMVVDAALRAELRSLAGSSDRRLYRDERLCAAAARPVQEALGRRTSRLPAHWPDLLGLASLLRESPLESFSAAQIHLAGLPRPVHQARIRTDVGDVHPDNLWAEFMVVGEADGEGKYAGPSAFTAEKIREGGLRDRGYDVVRWTGKEMFSTPQRVVERIYRALVRGGWTG